MMDIQSISDASIWYGSEQLQRCDWTLQLNIEQRTELEQAAEHVRTRGLVLDEVTRNDFDLPLLAPYSP